DHAAEREAAVASRRRLASRIVIYGILIVFALVYVVPLIVVVLNSFREQTEIARNGLIAFPQSFRLDAWASAWDSYCIGGACEGMKRYFYNSLWMTIPATVISTAFGAVNGYILSKWR